MTQEEQPLVSGSVDVNVALMIVHDGKVLFRRTESAEGGVEYGIPTVPLAPGQSLKDCTRTLATRLTDGTLSSVNFQRLCLLNDGNTGASTLTLGMFGALAPTDAEGGPKLLEGHELFPLGALPSPLSKSAELALRACRDRQLAIDLDELPLEVGLGIDLRPSAPPSPPEGAEDALVVQSRRTGPGVNPVLLTGALLAGTFAWACGVLSALAVHRLIRAETFLAFSAISALVLTVLSFRFGMKGLTGTAARNVARGIGIFFIGLATFGGLLAVAAQLGGDEERTAFWLWLFGALLTAVALRMIRRSAPDAAAPVRGARRHRPLRTVSWAVAVIGSLAVVFSPLREAVEDALAPGDRHVSLPEPPDDDD